MRLWIQSLCSILLINTMKRAVAAVGAAADEYKYTYLSILLLYLQNFLKLLMFFKIIIDKFIVG